MGSGCFICMDEFNRISAEVILSFSNILEAIQEGRKANQSSVNFFGEHIPLSQKKYQLCLTMNPGYAGRTPLPEDFNNQFKTTIMFVPDYRLIAEIMCACEGIDSCNEKSRTMVKVFEECKNQLSK